VEQGCGHEARVRFRPETSVTGCECRVSPPQPHATVPRHCSERVDPGSYGMYQSG
jgi:hypothetical protein